MQQHRIAIFGNSGSGKSTLANRIADRFGSKHLDLDGYAWTPEIQRRPVDQSIREIRGALGNSQGWVVEGCYADLIEPLLPDCTLLIFLNPGIEQCIANCRARPWEPDKYPSPEAQNERLEFLLGWVREYDTRDDEFSLRRHRALYKCFEGAKIEIRDPSEIPELLARL